MRKIKNIHLKDDPEKYRCFGCSPHNHQGLKLEFWEDGDELVSYWEPKAYLQSYPDVVHGGIQATLMDEIAGWVVYVKCGTVGVTADFSVKFKRPLASNKGQITVRARLLEQNKRLATISAWLLDPDGNVCSEASLRYFLMNEQQARENYNYPGVGAFFDPEEIEAD
jgi:uncharacterized protein (TIGR00369 family)